MLQYFMRTDIDFVAEEQLQETFKKVVRPIFIWKYE